MMDGTVRRWNYAFLCLSGYANVVEQCAVVKRPVLDKTTVYLL